MEIHRRLLQATLVLLLLIVSAGWPLMAHEEAATQPALKIVEIFRIDHPQAVVVGLQNYSRENPPELVLHLDDVPFPELVELSYHKEGETAGKDGVFYRQFLLQRNVVSQESWRHLYERNERTVLNTVGVEVALTREAGVFLPSAATSNSVDIRLVSSGFFTAGAVVILILAYFFFRLLTRSRVIRSVSPSTPADALARQIPYSLGRTQMAFWFFLVASSYLFIWAVTGQYNTITSSELILLGISASTALGSAIISGQSEDIVITDDSAEIARLAADLSATLADIEAKKAQVEVATRGTAELAGLTRELADLQHQALQIRKAQDFMLGKSRGFLIDLVSDRQGVTIHRFQILGWTVVLGLIYVFAVIGSLSLPRFDAVTLGLMGISSGTYLGFKFPSVKG